MMYKFILCNLMLFLLSFSSVFGQNPEYRLNTISTIYHVDTTKYMSISIEVINDCDINLFLWISNEDLSDLTADQKIRSYFFKRKGDFSFQELINDNLVDLTPSILYSTFICQIESQSTFVFNILTKEQSGDPLKYEQFMKDHMICIDDIYLSRYINLKSLKDHLYKNNQIVILSENLY